MSEDRRDVLAAYVAAASELMRLPLSSERTRAVGVVMQRVERFAAHVAGFALADDVEIAGVAKR